MPTNKLSYLMVQMNPHLGNLRANANYIKQVIESHQKDVNLIIFPELSLCGYPPEDLVFRDDFLMQNLLMLYEIREITRHCHVIVGLPQRGKDKAIYNCAVVIENQQIIATYYKQKLPNYKVFDEKRYFNAGSDNCIIEINAIKIGIMICEDIWFYEPAQCYKEAGASLLISINASPYNVDAQTDRLLMLKQRVLETELPIIYVNQVGGQDELVFDGTSMVYGSNAELLQRCPAFESGLFKGELNSKQDIAPYPELLPAIYDALVLGLRDYVNKNGFKKVLLGLSGGIDSSLTLAIAVDALGADAVTAIMLPYRYTSQLSKEQANQQAQNLDITYNSINIESIVNSAMAALADSFKGSVVDVTEQNIQSRSRGLVLMALSNKHNALLLTTGNKSEIAVGYATLYGDMAGGFNVLKDVVKTRVYELARYRNTLAPEHCPAIPHEVISRPPSAELAPDQIDEDNLPPYSTLDAIIELFVEKDLSVHQIIQHGFDTEVVKRVVRLIQLNEHKRSQAAIGTRITNRGFGRDRRYPITNGWQVS